LNVSRHTAAHIPQPDKSYGFHLSLLIPDLMTIINPDTPAPVVVVADYILGAAQEPWVDDGG
jgi:hypothetical protein